VATGKNLSELITISVSLPSGRWNLIAMPCGLAASDPSDKLGIPVESENRIVAGIRLLLALAASPPDASKPTKFEQFAASHPSVPAAFATVGTPDSFADEEYYGVDAFVFVNNTGARQAVRYQMMPERVVHLDAADAAKQPPNFLMDELPERLKRGPVTFHLRAQLAAAGDFTKDPTIPWPNDRKAVELGVLTINKAVPNSAEVEKKLLFLPGQLTDGIEQSDDPLIDIRDGAYALSFARRNQ
jgi:catalase